MYIRKTALTRVREIRSIKRAARWLRYRFSPRALILMYHRVTELTTDPFMLAVKPERFAEQMEVIRALCHPIPLQQLVSGLQGNKLTNRAVVVTFDDGYADNLHQARPILERYEIPATVFITAGYLGSQHEFWWDELDRLLLQPRALPNQLFLRISGSEFAWDAGEAEEYSSETFQRFRDWHVERVDDPHPRFGLFRRLYDRLHSLPYLARQRVLGEILAWAGAEPAGRVTHRSMTIEELILLEKGGLIDVGAHTMVHSNLAALTPGEQRQEIQESKALLETALNHPVTGFAFPYGSGNAETIAILKALGFESSCSSDADAVWPGADRYQLPRLGVRDWDRQRFTRWLSWWLDG